MATRMNYELTLPVVFNHHIVLSWVLTLPIAAVFAYMIFLIVS